MAKGDDKNPDYSGPADALVVFGITGDLAKKMTLKALYDLTENGTLKIPVIGVAKNDWSDDDLRKHARESVEAVAKEKKEDLDDAVMKKYLANFTYVQGDYGENDTYKRVKD